MGAQSDSPWRATIQSQCWSLVMKKLMLIVIMVLVLTLNVIDGIARVDLKYQTVKVVTGYSRHATDQKFHISLNQKY